MKFHKLQNVSIALKLLTYKGVSVLFLELPALYCIKIYVFTKSIHRANIEVPFHFNSQQLRIYLVL